MTLQSLLAFLADLIADAKAWVFDRLCDFWPDFYWFYQDPGYMVERWLGDWIPETRDFLSDPIGWLREEMAFALGFPRNFFDDPWFYLFRYVMIGFAKAGGHEIGRHADVLRQILVFFFRGEHDLLKRVEY